MPVNNLVFIQCINPQCSSQFDNHQVLFKCPECGDLLDVRYNWDAIELPEKLSDFADRWAGRSDRLNYSGVWRFRELLNFCEDEYKVSVGEGQTLLQPACGLGQELGMNPKSLFLQYEGMNP
ncbi:MAG: threonine synthase, partial [Planctomycetota bacterium]